VTSLLGQAGGRLLDRWVALLAVPGTLFVAVCLLASVLGQRHPFDLGHLAAWAQASSRTELWNTATRATVSLAVLALAAAATGLTAQILGAGQLLWWLGSWPRPLHAGSRRLTERRRRQWSLLQSTFQDLVAGGDRSSFEIAALGNRRNAIALAEPARPTWIGDRVAAVQTRVRNAYGLDLSAVWSRLWLILPDQPRQEIRAERARIDDAAVLSAWGLLYLIVGAIWWPAVLVGIVSWVAGWRTARQAVDHYAELVEAAVDLHGGALAPALGVPQPEGLTLEVGRAITRKVRKGT
jgi:hypothetical protein